MPAPPYEDLWVQRLMLRDRVRNEAYRSALKQSVNPGDVVLDVGAGTGILSLFAVKAGASKIFAVERTNMAEMARVMIERNGMEDRVEVMQADMETIELPEKVDVIVSEWMGRYGIDEYMHVPVLTARDRWLKPGGKMLPARVTAWMAPVWDHQLDQSLKFWRNRPYDVDLSPIADATVEEVFWVRHHITADTLLSEPKTMWTTDTYNTPVEEVNGPFHTSLSFTATRDGQLSGLGAWFYAELGGGIILTNSPFTPMTHWGRWVFPLGQSIEIKKGIIIDVEFGCEPAGPGCCHNSWSVRVGDSPWQHHDTRK
jgi:SAM-dependent methyltransferase